MKRAFLFLLIFVSPFASPLVADEECDEYQDEDCEPRRMRYEDMPDSSILRDEAHWPSQNQDPFLESLSR